MFNLTSKISQRWAAVAWLLITLVLAGGARAQLPDFTEMVEKNSPAVVNISTSGMAGLPDIFRMPEMPKDDGLQEFLRRFLERHRGGDPGAPGENDDLPDGLETNSLGSGFIMSKDGYVITNHHVVANADQVIVRLSDRREFSAKVIGSDPRSDVALLKIDANNLPTLTIGSSEKLKVGEWVLAIGSPFGFEHTVTAGIVSAKGRSLPSEQYVPFIQTDVAINPGNSGGPLFNMKGEVVGINAQIYSETGGFMGLSFAIPIEVAIEVAEQLKTKGKVSRGWLGVYIQEITRELAESFGMPKPMGALVAQVLPNSPSEKAGVKVGDVLLSVDGKPINHSADLPPIIGRYAIGSKAKLKILRNGKEMEIVATIEQLPDEEPTRVGEKRSNEPAQQKTLGLSLAPVPKELKEKLKISGGLLVKEVLKGPARKAGVREGDVIVSINGQAVNSVEELGKLIETLPRDRPVPLLVQREGGPVFLALKLGE